MLWNKEFKKQQPKKEKKKRKKFKNQKPQALQARGMAIQDSQKAKVGNSELPLTCP